MIRRPPRSTRTDTLSLHDALPIYRAGRGGRGKEHWGVRSLPSSAAVPRGKGRRSGGPFFPTARRARRGIRSEEHTSELQSLMRISYAVFFLTKKNTRH